MSRHRAVSRWAMLLASGLIVLSACAAPTRPEPLNTSSPKTTPTATKEPTRSPEPQATPLRLIVGQTADYPSGLRVTVITAGRGPRDIGGSATFKIAVRYENVGPDAQPFNEMDWQIEDAQGARTNDIAILEQNLPTLGSGEIAPGGTRSGDIYFVPSGSVAKVVYTATIFGGEEARASWAVSGSSAREPSRGSDASALYDEVRAVDTRLTVAAGHINSELGQAGTVSMDTLGECESVRDAAQSAHTRASALSDPRAGLLAQAFELELTRAQALVDGAEAARSGGDYMTPFERGQTAKAEYQKLEPRLDAAFGR